MSPLKLTLSVAAGVVLGGLVLFGVGRALDGSKARPLSAEMSRKSMESQKSTARGIGLAAIKYATDHDEVFPGRSDFSGKVGPYLTPELRGDLGRFVWVFPGGSKTALGNPSITELGRIDEPVGRTVLYADGNVRQFPAASDQG